VLAIRGPIAREFAEGILDEELLGARSVRQLLVEMDIPRTVCAERNVPSVT
jgi:hypothetical protein